MLEKTATYNDAITNSAARYHYFRNEDGGQALPLTGGTDTFEVSGLNIGNERAYFEVIFYNSDNVSYNATKATPTAGTVVIKGSMSPDRVFRPIDQGSFNAAEVYLDSHSIPAGSGGITNAEITLSGITGATHAKVFVARY